MGETKVIAKVSLFVGLDIAIQVWGTFRGGCSSTSSTSSTCGPDDAAVPAAARCCSSPCLPSSMALMCVLTPIWGFPEQPRDSAYLCASFPWPAVPASLELQGWGPINKHASLRASLGSQRIDDLQLILWKQLNLTFRDIMNS